MHYAGLRKIKHVLFALCITCMIALLVVPFTRAVSASGFPIQVFAGTWEPEAGFSEGYYCNMTFSFPDDGTMDMDFYEEFMGGAGTNRWTGPCTYDPETGVLKADLTTTFRIGSNGAEQVIDDEGATEITDTPFNKMRILLYDDKVSVIRLKEPCMEFVFTHPLMRRAFRAYANESLGQVPVTHP
mgnify:CR=1 FL=1